MKLQHGYAGVSLSNIFLAYGHEDNILVGEFTAKDLWRGIQSNNHGAIAAKMQFGAPAVTTF
jgi:hypothetical protein